MPTHILNGDSLKEQFPANIGGQVIIMREALVSGPVQAGTLEELYDLRAAYLLEAFGPQEKKYHDHVVPEFEQIISIPGDEKVYLWFEEDLFCQVNMWFCIYLMSFSSHSGEVNWVCPDNQLEYGFGAYKAEELNKLLNHARILSRDELNTISQMWLALQSDDIPRLEEYAANLKGDLKAVQIAVKIRKDQLEGKPGDQIRAIIDHTGADSFGTVFREFTQKHPSYGFGDLQVKRIYDSITAG